MNISDTFYVALCMTILIIGVVYWFWTQNQYIQRKLNLLENIVYEMKTSLNTPALQNESPPELQPANYPPAPSSELGEDDDLLHEELHTEIMPERIEELQEVIPELPKMPEEKIESELPAYEEKDNQIVSDSIESADDLQPGGVGSSMMVEQPADSSSTLDSMTLKELRRLAEQRKITGFSNMRKQALIDALRNEVHEIDLNI